MSSPLAAVKPAVAQTVVVEAGIEFLAPEIHLPERRPFVYARETPPGAPRAHRLHAALGAATAAPRAVVTRNRADFEKAAVRILNPFD